MTTISYPSTGIPINYLLRVQIQNTTSCPSNKLTIPSGNVVNAYSYSMLPVCPYGPHGSNTDVPSGYCFPLTSMSGANKGSVIYYYAPTCGTPPNVNYFCLYQFYDPFTQTCGNAKNVNGIFIGSISSSSICRPYYNDDGKMTSVSTLTLSSSPPSIWGKTKGITYVTTAGSCGGTILSYSWNPSSCQSSDDDDSSNIEYCTTSGLKAEYFYGKTCESKYIMAEYTQSASKSLNTFYSNVYECELSTFNMNGKNFLQYNLTIFYGNGNAKNCYYNGINNGYNNTYSIGSIYSKIQCSQTKPGGLSTATIVCLTFFIPLIFYIICWIIIVKIMKRGDLLSKALCLDDKKKGLATKEVSLQSKTDTENQIQRI
jgi:hypothetical protein